MPWASAIAVIVSRSRRAMPRPREYWVDDNIFDVAAQSGGEGNPDERDHADDPLIQPGDKQLGCSRGVHGRPTPALRR